MIYTVIAVVFIFLGTVSGSDFVWEVTDMFNNFIVLPNVIALFAITGTVSYTHLADRWSRYRWDQYSR